MVRVMEAVVVLVAWASLGLAAGPIHFLVGLHEAKAPVPSATVKPAPFTASVVVIRTTTKRKVTLPDKNIVIAYDEPDAAALGMTRELFKDVRLDNETDAPHGPIDLDASLRVEPLRVKAAGADLEVTMGCRLVYWRAGQRTKLPATITTDAVGKHSVRPTKLDDLGPAVLAATTDCLGQLRDKVFAAGIKLP
jgi:hypothetical protein